MRIYEQLQSSLFLFVLLAETFEVDFIYFLPIQILVTPFFFFGFQSEGIRVAQAPTIAAFLLNITRSFIISMPH